MAESKNPWKLLGSKEIYKDKRVRIRADNVIRPNKEKGVYVVVESSPGVIIAAVNENKEVALVRQWRYPQGKEYWELPAGHCDKEEDFLHAAKRELEEEAGILAKKWTDIGPVEQKVDRANDNVRLFLAQGLAIGRFIPDPAEAKERRFVPIREAVEMANDGRLSAASALAGIYRAACRLGVLKLQK
ncbi:MAG: NUDIX hydrolase [Nanoarchaeota archaeon]